ncbi:type II toxin-antitoxin system VapC family toxin [Sphingomonas profundi]|uniref:type II toxin-antitoxin system VapC family toxin n=1 Tax=Alterirhizorhabdus profundi TaxID=2681549 RepID=UPI0012E8FF17|nr:PIN domain-containing protein [Sphingomonas profundi]
MILADTSIWIDHLRAGDPLPAARLRRRQVIVIGEIALGSLRRRRETLADLHALPRAVQAGEGEVQVLIEAAPLHGLGIGYVDAHLLASVRLTPGASLWTSDRRLHAAARWLGIAPPAD